MSVKRDAKTVVTEADWVAAIQVARIVKRRNRGVNDMAWTARRTFRMALALLNEERLDVQRKVAQ